MKKIRPCAFLFACLLTVAACRQPAEQTVVCLPAEHRDLKLPDGSSAMLNADSRLSFSASTWEAAPEVELSGEAFFKVKKKSRFLIKTPYGSAEVIGGQANVYAREGRMEAQCVTGKVQVFNPDHSEKTLLGDGEEVAVENGHLLKRSGLRFYPVWMKGETVLRDVPAPRAFAELGRQYDKRVLLDSVEGVFSGKFGHKDLDKALQALCKKMNLACKVQGDTVRVKNG